MIMLLDQEGELGATDLQKVKSNYYVALELAMSLEEIGLVDVEKIATPKVTYIIKLTAKGKNVAGKLREIRKIIGEG